MTTAKTTSNASCFYAFALFRLTSKANVSQNSFFRIAGTAIIFHLVEQSDVRVNAVKINFTIAQHTPKSDFLHIGESELNNFLSGMSRDLFTTDNVQKSICPFRPDLLSSLFMCGGDYKRR